MLAPKVNSRVGLPQVPMGGAGGEMGALERVEQLLEQRDEKVDSLTAQVEALTAQVAALTAACGGTPPSAAPSSVAPPSSPRESAPVAYKAAFPPRISTSPARPRPTLAHAARAVRTVRSLSPARAGARVPPRSHAAARANGAAVRGDAAARTHSPARTSPSPARASPSPVRRNSAAPPAPPPYSFDASQRGGPLSRPMPWRGLSASERENPYEECRGPSLLTRSRFGAEPRSSSSRDGESRRSRSCTPQRRSGTPQRRWSQNVLLDENPHNDPVWYHPCKSLAYPPSDYAGPDDARETDDLASLDACHGNALRLGFAFGYNGRSARQNLFYNGDGRIVYHTASLGVVYDKQRHQMMFFGGHDNDIRALAIHPDGIRFASGQEGKDPKICIWSSRPTGEEEEEGGWQPGSATLPCLCVIVGDHQRAIMGLSFSAGGEILASMGNDNNHKIALYRWVKDGGSGRPGSKTAEQMRLGIDKVSQVDAVYALEYNPVTEQIVATGKKLLRFFGVKPSVGGSSESALWSKKGVFGRGGAPSDVLCVAFGADGVSYAGTSEGTICRFAEQTIDLAVKAHEGKVTALWYHTHSELLVSSGDDGLVRMWRPDAFSRRDNPEPHMEIDLARYLPTSTLPPSGRASRGGGGGGGSARDSAEGGGAYQVLRGVGQLRDGKDTGRRGSAAAAHALYGDEEGRLLIGTVCNEIYELDMNAPEEPPMCYMQGHYDELWGLSTHPTRQQMATCGEDWTLRVWDLESRTMQAVQRLPGPGRSCCYSPDGRWIAVGLGTGGKAKRNVVATEGKWELYDASGTQLVCVAEPEQRHQERIDDIKFSPDGRFIAVCAADNLIDVYALGDGPDGPQPRYRGQLRGHSSFVRKCDWSADSRHLQSCCGASEHLFWNLYREGEAGDRLVPHQEKTASLMRETHWHTFSSVFGWPVRGIWQKLQDATDNNACARSHHATRGPDAQGLLVSADDFGAVNLFRWPCILPGAAHKKYTGHSAHVTNVAFTAADHSVISTGGDDRTVFQWEVVNEE